MPASKVENDSSIAMATTVPGSAHGRMIRASANRRLKPRRLAQPECRDESPYQVCRRGRRGHPETVDDGFVELRVAEQAEIVFGRIYGRQQFSGPASVPDETHYDHHQVRKQQEQNDRRARHSGPEPRQRGSDRDPGRGDPFSNRTVAAVSFVPSQHHQHSQ